jgi:hypothetical protein
VIATSNLADPGQQSKSRKIELVFLNLLEDAGVSLERVDNEHGNVLPKYAAMGKHLDPTPVQVQQFNNETTLPPPERSHLIGGQAPARYRAKRADAAEGRSLTCAATWPSTRRRSIYRSR